MVVKKKGKLTKLNRATALERPEAERYQPHSMVITQGKTDSNVKHLMHDIREVMEPNTASNLKILRSNVLRDFTSVAGKLRVSHVLVLTRTSTGINLKLIRMPGGPTIYFKVNNYCLSRDVRSHSKKQMVFSNQFMFPPCLMTNLKPNEGEKHYQLCAQMFLDMFPAISPDKGNIQNIKRCCLFHYDPEKDELEFRQYAIRVVPIGICKATKKIHAMKAPNLGNYTDISEFVLKSDVLSDSETEDIKENKVNVSKKIKKAGLAKRQSSVRLSEIGPRLTLKLIKIEDRICEGTILYHNYIHKTPEEIIAIKKSQADLRSVKIRRQREQLRNLEKKKQEKEEERRRSREAQKNAAEKRKRRENDDDEEEKERKLSQNSFRDKKDQAGRKNRFKRNTTNSKPVKRFRANQQKPKFRTRVNKK